MKKSALKIAGLGIILGVVVYGLLSAQTYSTNPKTIPFQGRLQTQAGGTYPTGSYNLTIRLYTGAVGGAPIWSETHNSVPAVNGMFNLMLGSVNSLAPVSFNAPKFLAISVNGGSEMTPRQQVVPAIYALDSGKLNGLEAGNNTGQIPVNNDIRNQGLNSDMLDGYHAGNAAGNIPVSNALLNATLYADRAKEADGFTNVTGSTNITGMIAMFDKACPTGWDQYTPLNGRFPKGKSALPLGADGAPTHVHPNGGATDDDGTPNKDYGTIVNGSCWACSTDNPPSLSQATHAHSLTGNTGSAQAQPPYQEVVFCKKK